MNDRMALDVLLYSPPTQDDFFIPPHTRTLSHAFDVRCRV